MPVGGQAIAAKLKIKKIQPDMKIGKRCSEGACWDGFIIVPEPPPLLGMAGDVERGVEDGEWTPLHSQRFNCT